MKLQYDKVKFFRRRQFLLGPEFADFDGWNKIKIDNTHLITAHPDLNISYLESGNNKVLLLGYFIDPFNPDFSDNDILANFLDEQIDMDNIILKLNKLVGRFVLIISKSDKLWLFHDACALRQVNYLVDKSGHVWCASQPNLLAEMFRFDYDEEMISFRNLPVFVKGKDEFWFPCDLTPYKEIKYLLPNHYLDLNNGDVSRFWPRKGSFTKINLDECIERVSDLLKNSIKSGASRFNLKMSISAGCDSRKSLAASKEVKEKITFYTHTPIKGSKADIEVPSKLLPKLGLKHYVVNLQPMDDEFKKYFETNNTWPREKHGNIAYSFMRFFGTDCVVLNSNISEYSGVWYWLPKSNISARNLAVLRSLNHKKIINEIEKWLSDAKPSCDAAGMNILVLFDLELRSRWVSQALAEYDIAFETFNPYNNRYLFQLELSVDEKIREGRNLRMPKRLIKKMWPEVLSEPINPEKGLLKKVKRFMQSSRFLFPIIRNFRYIKQTISFIKNNS
ncbi:MAG: hypothetical protein H5U07_06440 [Candidatus Aminicenantes bacterium]|nr:hypothetical protein [Candidatus Aminicenantes bacterium]